MSRPWSTAPAGARLLVGATGFATLQGAVTAAADNNQVRLAAGSYGGTVNYGASGLIVIGQTGAQQNVTYNNLLSGVGITVIAANLADTIATDDGDDRVFGNGGIDNISTGASATTSYFVESATTAVVEAAAGGNDAVYSAVSYTLTSGSEVETLSTSSHAGIGTIHLTGNSLNQTIVGNDGTNTLFGAGGTDSWSGSAATTPIWSPSPRPTPMRRSAAAPTPCSPRSATR